MLKRVLKRVLKRMNFTLNHIQVSNKNSINTQIKDINLQQLTKKKLAEASFLK